MSGVRGPNSALTEFLRSQGINATDIRDRWDRRRNQEPQQLAEEAQEDAADTAEALDDPEVRVIAEAAAAKRKAVDDPELFEGTALCAYCRSRFTLTVYTRETKNGVLCRRCGAQGSKAKARKNDTTARKKRKAMAQALVDLRTDLSPSLQDLCISTVAKYIDDVDELGDLTSQNMQKIANILTKNRRLSNSTVQLFLRNDATTLELWDCSALTPEAFNLIPSMCPNLERLTLSMCGQLNDENLMRLAQLKNLKELVLDGPFLVRFDAWIEFFETVGPRLEKFDVRSVYRISAEVLAVLVDNATNLRYLGLRNLSQVSDPAPFFLLRDLEKLEHLELCDMEEGILTDEALCSTLKAIGSQLKTLVIKQGPELTDKLVAAIGENCQCLQRLELVNLTSITEDAVTQMFQTWSSKEWNKSLSILSLERTIGVGDQALDTALEHLHGSLVELNVNSLKLLTQAIIPKLAAVPNLTKLDIGFLGFIEPVHIYKLATSPHLKLVLAYGNIRLSGMPLPTTPTVVGTM